MDEPGAKPDPSPSTPPNRPYRSSLRARHTAETRDAILESLAREIVEQGTGELTVEALAERAGVATRTVYRHFPNRQALLDGLADLLEERFADRRDAGALPGLAEDLRTSADLEAVMPAMMRHFEELEPLTSAMVLAANQGRLRSRRHDARTEVFRALVAGELEGLAPEERHAAFAVIRHLLSAQTWFVLHHQFGLNSEAAGQAVGRAVRAILAGAGGAAATP